MSSNPSLKVVLCLKLLGHILRVRAHVDFDHGFHALVCDRRLCRSVLTAQHLLDFAPLRQDNPALRQLLLEPCHRRPSPGRDEVIHVQDKEADEATTFVEEPRSRQPTSPPDRT